MGLGKKLKKLGKKAKKAVKHAGKVLKKAAPVLGVAAPSLGLNPVDKLGGSFDSITNSKGIGGLLQKAAKTKKSIGKYKFPGITGAGVTLGAQGEPKKKKKKGFAKALDDVQNFAGGVESFGKEIGGIAGGLQGLFGGGGGEVGSPIESPVQGGSGGDGGDGGALGGMPKWVLPVGIAALVLIVVARK